MGGTHFANILTLILMIMYKNEKVIEQTLKGSISATTANGQSLDDLCLQLIPDYNPDRFEAIAIRLFIGDETLVTIYALDKIRQEDSTIDKNKIPVKKFKLTEVSLPVLFSYCRTFNCTLSTGNYQLEDIEVINK